MEVKRTMTMNWDGLGVINEDDDLFFDAQRLSKALPQDLASSSSNEEFDDSRISFSSTIDFPGLSEFQTNEYEMWMASPKSITDRRRRLFKDMGLGSSKDMSIPVSANGAATTQIPPINKDILLETNVCKPEEKNLSPVSVTQKSDNRLSCELLSSSSGSHDQLSRTRSGGSIDASFTYTKRREEEMLDSISKQSITRTISDFSTRIVGLLSPSKGQEGMSFVAKVNTSNEDDGKPISLKESILLIKNLDNGNEFMVKECNKEWSWNKLIDVKTGNQISIEEFEKNTGHSPKVKELMKKVINNGGNVSGDRKLTPGNSSFHKSKKKGASLFKNIKLGSYGSSKTDKDKLSTITGSPSINNNNPQSINDQKPPSQWVKSRVHGKPCKEFTALHMSQEIQGHDGSIWSMKFTYDGQYLATAGEYRVIHIWEVQEFDVMGMRGGDDLSSVGSTPVHRMAMAASPDGRPPLSDATSEKKKKRKKKKGIPNYVHALDTIFGLSETPFCKLNGHTDDVLDLSWSRSRLLLSSSMDKTVRLWDIETKECVKTFSHNEYVTCVQFNPADDDYFISGSLDSKVRIWNIPDRQVVDWIDLHEMVTAVGYSNDGKVSVVGSNKGICRFYNTIDCKLEFKDKVALKTKKKPQSKKITGFQFSTLNPSEVLVTSADSRIRILDGTKLVQKFKGYKNNNSQLSADYSPDGKYIISASEDSHVYIWKHEETKGKHKYPIITSYEQFPCKDVSVTAPWPGSNKLEQPLVTMHSKKHTKISTTTQPPQSISSSPIHDETSHDKLSSTPLPPFPKRSNSSLDNIEEIDHHTNVDSSVGPCESFSSSVSSSGRYDELTSPSPNTRGSSGWGGNHGQKTIQATAWGLVIVTAGLGGEIKVFQNVGLPFKVGRL